MNPETKLVLDALSKSFDDLESRWDLSFAEAGEKLEKSSRRRRRSGRL
jgi:hypothetical protein